MTNPITGPLWPARNWSADDGEGSIHDDSTAAKLGFRGGTVAGDVHMNQFSPVLVEVFGNAWFERGNLSLSFKNATVDLERAQVFVEPLAVGASQTKVWMVREDGIMNHPYHLSCKVVCVGQSPQTEYVWSETLATNDAGDVVATMLMQSRAMKASSPAYQE